VRAVELPLALPLIFGGIRISTVNVLATATLGPEGGVVTLGDPIINPSTYGDAGRLGAAIVVALLAVAAELGLSALQRAVTPTGLKLTDGAASRRARFPIPKRRAQPAP
jgi:ABC-type proline/glycine betaine transport system permease subunit